MIADCDYDMCGACEGVGMLKSGNNCDRCGGLGKVRLIGVGDRVEVQSMSPGGWVWTERATVTAPLPEEQPVPSEQWRIVEYDIGGKMCVNVSRMRLVASAAEVMA